MLYRLIKYICEYKGIEESDINEDSNMIVDLGITSMELFEILCNFEEEIEFDEENLELFICETVGQLAAILESIKFNEQGEQ